MWGLWGKKGEAEDKAQSQVPGSSALNSSALNTSKPSVPQPAASWAPEVAHGAEGAMSTKHLEMWAQQTAYGLAGGFVLGWFKGLRDNQHLAGRYAPGSGSVYDGTFAKFRVPLNIHEASLSSARWGLAVGAFAGAFSALNIFLESKTDKMAKGGTVQVDAQRDQESTAAPLDMENMALKALPSALAGTGVGSLFGFLRQGGSRGALLGGMLGLGIGGGIKSLEVVVDGIVKKMEEDERIKAKLKTDTAK